MRIRLRHLLAVLARRVRGVFAVAAPAFAQETPHDHGRARPSRSSRTRPTRSATRSSPTGGVDRRLPAGAEPAASGVERSHLGHALVRRAAHPHVEVRDAAGAVDDEGARGPHPRATSRRPRTPAPSAEDEKTRYEAQLAEARGEAGKIIEEARQAAEQVRRDLIARAEVEANEVARPCPGRHRRPAAAGAHRAAHPGCRALDRPRRAHRRAQPRPRHAAAARRQLHQPGREQLTDG